MDTTIFDFTIYCDSLQKEVTFTSEIMDDNEMFDLTKILSYFGKSNNDIVKWFSEHMDHLHMIDSIITDEDINDDPELLSISDDTIRKIDNHWFVNINTLLEYLRNVDLQFSHQILAQVMFNKVDELNEEYSDDSDDSVNSDDSDNSEEYTDNSNSSDCDSENSARSGRSI